MKLNPFAPSGVPNTLNSDGEQAVLNQSISIRKIGALILANLVALYRNATVVTASKFARPNDTTPYASGDLVANSTTAGSVAPIQLDIARVSAGAGVIRRVRLLKSSTSATNATFRVHFYTSSPTVNAGDNSPWLTTQSGYIGSFELTTDKVFTDGAFGVGIPNSGSEIAFVTAANSRTIYALIEARGAYTPASGEFFTISAEVTQS